MARTELSVTRWSPEVLCCKRFAGWQSPFREIPKELPEKPGNVSPAFSPMLTMQGRARNSETEMGQESRTQGRRSPTKGLNINKLQSLHIMPYHAAINCHIFKEQ